MELKLYEQYDRKEVHDIFDPNSNFTVSTGTWGLQGIVPLKNSDGDYVLFVTFGTHQGTHTFQEEVYDDGTITWQSQPSNKLTHKYVVDLINLDPEINSVYLFLRTSKSSKYTYMGPLEYVSHDNSRECPVYFMLRMCEFDLNEVQKHLPNLRINNRRTGAILPSVNTNTTLSQIGALTLKNTPVRKPISRTGVSNSDFTGRNVDFQGEAKKNSATGNAGEDLVVKYEKERLTKAGCKFLAEKVIPTRKTIGNTAKFDVLSYETTGAERYIEVKTTTGSAENKIHISEGEVAFSERHANQYYLYRVFNYDRQTGNGDLYIQPGAIDRTGLIPDNYIF